MKFVSIFLVVAVSLAYVVCEDDSQLATDEENGQIQPEQIESKQTEESPDEVIGALRLKRSPGGYGRRGFGGYGGGGFGRGGFGGGYGGGFGRRGGYGGYG